MSLPQKVKNFILQHQLLQKNDTVIIGVSGGADSMSLLKLLAELRYDCGFTPIVAHFNHKLRKGSDTDQRFVEEYAKKHTLLFLTANWANPTSAKGSLEECARDARLAFFTQCQKDTKANKIALAHNKNDCAETVLMRILRGSGLEGLRAIQPKKIIDGLTIIRPLLDISRDEIETYCSKQKISYREDPSNKKTIFTRNKVRLKLLPTLKKDYNPNIHQTLANVQNSIALDYDYIFDQASKRFHKLLLPSRKNTCRFTSSSLKKEHPAIRRMIYRISIKTLKGNTNQLTLKHLTEIEDLLNQRPKGSIVHLPSKCSVKKCAKHLTFIIE